MLDILPDKRLWFFRNTLTLDNGNSAYAQNIGNLSFPSLCGAYPARLTVIISLALSSAIVTAADVPTVPDDQLEYLNELSKLERLQLHNTAITDEGVKTLHEALPDCKIER